MVSERRGLPTKSWIVWGLVKQAQGYRQFSLLDTQGKVSFRPLLGHSILSSEIQLSAFVGMGTAYRVELLKKRSKDQLRLVSQQAANEFTHASAEEILAWAATEFGDLVIVTQSMTKTTLSSMIQELDLDITMVFIDTGFHFVETLKTRDALV
jgi:hypothetical protein